MKQLKILVAVLVTGIMTMVGFIATAHLVSYLIGWL
jgi:hypothetical protein